MTRTRARAGVAAAILIGATVLPVASAGADYAAECAHPTDTVSADSAQALDLAASDVVLIASGTFTGGVNAAPNGSVICVAAGATFQPAYMNNAAGRLLIQGKAIMAGVVFAAGVSIENSGTLEFPSGIGSNGPAEIDNLAGGTITVGNGLTLNSGAILTNDGTLTIDGPATLNGDTGLVNAAEMTVRGTMIVNGAVSNTGRIAVTGAVTVNGGAALTNECVLTATGITNGGATTNTGLLDFGAGPVLNQGRLQQASSGLTLGRDFTNNQQVTGFGRYGFTANTTTQGTFVGDSSAQPIVVDDASPSTVPGQIFDTQSGTVDNTVSGAVPPTRGVAPAGCSQPQTPSTDLVASKTGPAAVAGGAPVSYTVTLANLGPAEAVGVVLTDDIPPALTNVTTTPTATITGSRARWSVGTMAPDSSLTFTVTGTAPASGTLLDVVSATTTTPDVDPANNDGSLPAARVATAVKPVPVNHPPVVPDQSVSTTPRAPVFDDIPVHDIDAGQRVTTAKSRSASYGLSVVTPGAVYAYHDERNYTGRDSIVVTGCDNGTPVLCDTGTIHITVYPVAGPDFAVTQPGTPVSIPVLRNDIGLTSRPAVTTVSQHGSTVPEADDRSIRYTPRPGFRGVDTFRYDICSPSDPDVCASAQVTVDVVLAAQPPTVGDDLRMTTANTPVNGRVPVTVPPLATASAKEAVRPHHGAAVVTATGAFVYTPQRDYTGWDTFTITACRTDVAPSPCDAGAALIGVRPMAAADAAVAEVGRTVTIPVKANDEGDAGAPTVMTAPPHGRAAVRADGRVDYVSDGAFAGVDTFSYRVCSPSAADLCATASVTVTVSAAVLPVRPGGSGQLPMTAAPPVLAWIIIAWGMIGTGVALVLLVRRRRIVAR